MYTADQRSGSMHGKSFVLDSVYAGIDERNLYGRLDFAAGIPEAPFELVVNLESWPAEAQRPRRVLRVDVGVESGAIHNWSVSQAEEDQPLASSHAGRASDEVKLVIQRNFEFKLPLAWLLAAPVPSTNVHQSHAPVVTRVRLRFSMWQNKLPIDALPLEGWIELQLLTEDELAASVY
jgi:hypothetical protein